MRSWPADGPLWGDRWGLAQDTAGAWPTSQQLKAQHLAQVHQEIADLKAAAEAQQLSEEWQQHEQL